MNQRELKRLGFKKQNVSAEESGDASFYFYTMDIVEGIHLITPANDEIVNNKWYVEFFDFIRSRSRTTPQIRFYEYDSLFNFIKILEKNKVILDT
jgi:hypothetical protein